jgi:hypothetical protein
MLSKEPGMLILACAAQRDDPVPVDSLTHQSYQAVCHEHKVVLGGLLITDDSVHPTYLQAGTSQVNQVRSTTFREL